MSFRLDRDKGEGIPERIVYRREEVAAAGGKVRYVCGRFPYLQRQTPLPDK